MTLGAGGLAAALLARRRGLLDLPRFAQETLGDLIRAGQREAVLAAITSPDLDVNTPEADGSTPLLWATYKVDHELVRALLKAGAKANVTNKYGSSPLTEAVKLGDVELVRMLLDAKADPELAESGWPDRAHARLHHRLDADREAADRPRRAT